MGWLIALGILILLAILPLGASVRYDADGLVLSIIAGWIRIPILPSKKKDTDNKKTKEEIKSKVDAGEKVVIGEPLTEELIQKIISSINANGIMRKLCILGGEPLHPINIPVTNYLIKRCKEVFHNLEIYVWSGYDYEVLKSRKECQYILKNANYLIDGLFIEELKDTTLPLRGSSNQRIIEL